MGKLADAIRDRRKGQQRRMGFGAAVEQQHPSMLVGAIGFVEGADFCVALSDSDAKAIEAAGVDIWGARLVVLTRDSVANAKESGASFVSFVLDDARADAMLDEDVDYVIRLLDRRVDESEARALGSLRPTAISPELEFPLTLSSALELRRLVLLASSPLGVTCPPDVSVGDLEAMRDSGVAAILLAEGASASDVADVKQRVLDLPERKPRRDDDAQPLIPTARQSGQTDREDEG